MEKLAISMAMFNSYLELPEGSRGYSGVDSWIIIPRNSIREDSIEEYKYTKNDGKSPEPDIWPLSIAFHSYVFKKGFLYWIMNESPIYDG